MSAHEAVAVAALLGFALGVSLSWALTCWIVMGGRTHRREWDRPIVDGIANAVTWLVDTLIWWER